MDASAQNCFFSILNALKEPLWISYLFRLSSLVYIIFSANKRNFLGKEDTGGGGRIELILMSKYCFVWVSLKVKKARTFSSVLVTPILWKPNLFSPWNAWKLIDTRTQIKYGCSTLSTSICTGKFKLLGVKNEK